MKLPNCINKSGLNLGAIIKATDWPKNVSLFALINLLMMSTTCLLAHSQQAHQQEPMATNEIPTSALEHDHQIKNFSQYSRDVTNLRLLPDLRSIKLRWTYEHSESNRPESFKIRYCELTSWMAEIKCRHRDIQAVRVADVKLKQQQRQQSEAFANFSHSLPPFVSDRGAPAAAANAPALNSTTVIKQLQQPQQPLQEASKDEFQRVNRAAGGNGASANGASGLVSQTFETQIYDLRALTNYTFYVNVLNFVGEQTDSAGQQLSTLASKVVALSDTTNNSHRHQRPSRRLDLVRRQHGAGNELTSAATSTAAGQLTKLGAMIETTKPFSAEAVKCMAGSSEVLVNTGRYFGGRISVEGQLDSRCQLLGNKSSDQAVYSFHIDHEICHGKIMDGDRIETMILVHENKDILTHNTARFLVVCNIAQKSFTVKASVSLPKVMNSLNQQQQQPNKYLSQRSRPATIIPLSGRPLSSSAFMPFNDNSGANYDQVKLGSMPGIYRLIRADGSSSTAPTALASTHSPSMAPPPPPLSTLAPSSSIHTTTTADSETSATASSAASETSKNGLSSRVAIMNLPTNSTFNQQQQQQGRQLSHMESSVSTPTIADASALALLLSGHSARQPKELSILSSDATMTTIGADQSGNNNLMRSMEVLPVPVANFVAKQQQQQQQWQLQGQGDKMQSPLLPKPVEVSSKILFVERAATAGGEHPLLPSSPMSASITPVSQREARLFHASSGPVFQQQQQHVQFPLSPRLSDHTEHQLYAQTVASSASLASGEAHHFGHHQSSVAATKSGGGDDRTDGHGLLVAVTPPPPAAATTKVSTNDSDDESVAPIIMTNNHRIADDYLALSQVPTAMPSGARQTMGRRLANETSPSEPIDVRPDFSIKYSANKVDEYSLGKLGSASTSTSTLAPATQGDRERAQDRSLPLPPSMFSSQPTSSKMTTTTTATTSQMPRSRSGRMRQIASEQANVIERQVSPSGQVDFESRMGDVMQVAATDLIVGDASNRSEQVVRASSSDVTISELAGNSSIGQSQQPPQQHSLAHNITGALIRWSLKQLGNLARKSLESLVVDERSRPESQAPFTPSDHSSLAIPRQSATQRMGAADSSETAHHESHLDGFLVNSRSASHSKPQAAASATTNRPGRSGVQPKEATQRVTPSTESRQQQAEVGRPAGRQQLGLSTSTPPPPTTQTIATSTPTPPNGRVRQKSKMREASNSEQQEDTIAQLDSAGSDKRHSKADEPAMRALWPIYVLLALICLIVLIMLAFHFVLSSGHCIRLHQARLAPLRRKPTASGHQQSTSGKALFARLNETFSRNRNCRDADHQSATRTNAMHDTYPNSQVNFANSMEPNRVSGKGSRSDKLTGRFVPPQCLLVAGAKSKTVSSLTTIIDRGQAQIVSDHGILEPVATVIAPRVTPQNSSPSPSDRSATTRSTSAASTNSTSSAGGENYCKNQEQFVVYSDYLLLEDDKSSLTGALNGCYPAAKLHGISSASESFA